MSLRIFHLFFIGLSVVLAAFCAAWATGQYRADQQAGHAVAAAAALVCGGALALYGRAFQRKSRNL